MRLLENTKLLGVILVSACHTDLGDANERASGYYARPWRWTDIAANATWIEQFHSLDDPFIPISEARHVASSLGLVAGETYHEFENRSHFFSPPFDELIDILKRRGAFSRHRGFNDLLNDIVADGRPRVAILDGGFSTQLEKRGVKSHLESDLWTAKVLMDTPEHVCDVHSDFLSAGADVIITSTYQASVPTLMKTGNMDVPEAEALMKSAVRIAKQAVEQTCGRVIPLVAASCGCFGATRSDGSEYTGDYRGMSIEALAEFHAERLRVLLSGSEAETPDVVAFETIPSCGEVRAIVRALEQVYENCSLPLRDCWITCCCKDSVHLSSGEPFSEAAAIASSSKYVNAVGVNCTPPEFVLDLLKAARAAAPSAHLVCYPNSGESFNAQDKSWSKGDADSLSLPVLGAKWRDEGGATFIGGCCRVDSSAISDLKAALQ